MYLAFGASRVEACRPIAKEALGTAALTPVINQMKALILQKYLLVIMEYEGSSVLGIISIPGMMSEAILEGSSTGSQTTDNYYVHDFFSHYFGVDLHNYSRYNRDC